MTIKLSHDDLNLLSKKNNYGWQEFYKNYENKDGYDIEFDLESIIKTVKFLQNIYSITNNEGCIIYENVEKLLFNNEFYKECYEYQLDYPENITNIDKNININEKTKYNSKKCEKCAYCKIFKPKQKLQKCSACLITKYCSIACQKRDWKLKHKFICSTIEKDDQQDNDDEQEQEQEQYQYNEYYYNSQISEDVD